MNLQNVESEQEEVERKYLKLASTIPNLIHESVPIGPDESANKEIKRWGNIPKFDFKIKDHIDISEDLDLVDLERAAKVAGAQILLFKKRFSKIKSSTNSFWIRFSYRKRIFPCSTTIYD